MQRLTGAPKDCSDSSLPPAQSPKPNRPERQPKQKRGPNLGHGGHSRRRQVGRSASARQRPSHSPDAMLTGPWLSDIVPSVTLSTFGGAVAQRFRVPACQAGSRGFKSRQPRQSSRGARPPGRLAHVRHEGLTPKIKTLPSRCGHGPCLPGLFVTQSPASVVHIPSELRVRNFACPSQNAHTKPSLCRLATRQ